MEGRQGQGWRAGPHGRRRSQLACQLFLLPLPPSLAHPRFVKFSAGFAALPEDCRNGKINQPASVICRSILLAHLPRASAGRFARSLLEPTVARRQQRLDLSCIASCLTLFFQQNNTLRSICLPFWRPIHMGNTIPRLHRSTTGPQGNDSVAARPSRMNLCRVSQINAESCDT